MTGTEHDETTTRARAVLARGYPAVVVCLLLAAALGGWLTYGAYADPGTHTESRTVDRWSLHGEFDHDATVTNGTGVPFEAGATLANRSVYFLGITPTLDGRFGVTYEGDRPVDARVRTRLVVRGVERVTGDREPTTYWRRTRPLGTHEVRLEDGARAEVPLRVDVARTVREARNASRRLGTGGRIELRVRTTVTATRAGRTETATFVTPITPDRALYRVDGETETATFAREETVTVANEPGSAATVGGPLLIVVGLSGAAGLASARRRGALALSPAERAWLGYRDDRTDFDEWIARVRLPSGARHLPTGEAESLADLVDVAVDTDAAVLEDPETGVYSVVHDGYRYVFEPPTVSGEDGALAGDGRRGDAGSRPEPDLVERADPQPNGTGDVPPVDEPDEEDEHDPVADRLSPRPHDGESGERANGRRPDGEESPDTE